MFASTIQKTYIGWILFLVSALSWIVLFASSPASAQDKGDLCTGANLTFDNSGTNTSCKTDADGKPCTSGKDCDSDSGINDLIADIVNIFSIVVGIVAVIMIIYGGFRYITSGGDSGNVTTAKNIILYAIVGLIIVAFAQFIVKFILSKVAT
ncbi:hypothetical protein HZB74_03585 [Candidatus Saccharibacteria bacterium]|nr:hypothetical protein [Candidatus Saccharibacteria bacterium]